jgi:hypothetical protein
MLGRVVNTLSSRGSVPERSNMLNLNIDVFDFNSKITAR